MPWTERLAHSYPALAIVNISCHQITYVPNYIIFTANIFLLALKELKTVDCVCHEVLREIPKLPRPFLFPG